MFIKSNGVAVAWGVVALVLVVFISGLLALLFPADVRNSSDISPPQVGKVYSKEEIEQKERRAQEELAKAREEFARIGFSGVIRAEWTTSLPYAALVALAAILVLGRRARAVSIVIMSLPLLVLLLVAQVSLVFLLLAIAALVLYLKFRDDGGGLPRVQ